MRGTFCRLLDCRWKQVGMRLSTPLETLVTGLDPTMAVAADRKIAIGKSHHCRL